jgi:hypothetical protein
MISNQWVHIWTTLASIKSVQIAKTQDANVSWCVLSVAAFSAWRAFRRVIALDLCNCTNFTIASTNAGQYANYEANPVPFGGAPYGYG